MRTKINFPSGQLSLEGILHIPEGEGPFPAVIICHPHPLYGGSMNNNVVNNIAETLTQSALISLKFNFRGVGGSEGSFGQGMGEQEDVNAAISFMTTLNEVDSTNIGLAGYSAGAGFAFPVCFNNDRIKALAAISPPLSIFDFEFFKSCPKPKFLIAGKMDDFIPPSQFLEFCQELPEPKECETVAGADHFWWGYESGLSVKVTEFFNRVFYASA